MCIEMVLLRRMASLSRASNRTINLVPTATVVVIGALVGTVVTDVARENIYDIDMDGGDAAYPAVAAFVLNAVLAGKTVKLVSVGMLSASITTIAREWGLV